MKRARANRGQYKKQINKGPGNVDRRYQRDCSTLGAECRTPISHHGGRMRAQQQARDRHPSAVNAMENGDGATPDLFLDDDITTPNVVTEQHDNDDAEALPEAADPSEPAPVIEENPGNVHAVVQAVARPAHEPRMVAIVALQVDLLHLVEPTQERGTITREPALEAVTMFDGHMVGQNVVSVGVVVGETVGRFDNCG